MPNSTLRPAALGCHLDTELTARVDVLVVDTERVALVVGDDLHAVRLIGPLDVVRRLVVEADRQLTYVGEGDR